MFGGGGFGGFPVAGAWADPFGSDPFLQNAMDHMMASFPGFGQPFRQPFPFGQPMSTMPGFAAPFGIQQGFGQVPLAPNPGASSRPRIEEVNDMGQPSTREEPIVEEPDDDNAEDAPNQRSHKARRTSPSHAEHTGPRQRGPGLNFPAGNGMATFSYSSTSYSSSHGPGGAVTYSTSQTTRVGPGGVRETQATVKDGRTGQHSMTISRGVGDKEYTTTRVRDASGREMTQQQLRGLQAHEVHGFDNEWRTHAEQSLRDPGFFISGAPGQYNPTARAPAPVPALPAPAPASSGYRSVPVMGGAGSSTGQAPAYIGSGNVPMTRSQPFYQQPR